MAKNDEEKGSQQDFIGGPDKSIGHDNDLDKVQIVANKEKGEESSRGSPSIEMIPGTAKTPRFEDDRYIRRKKLQESRSMSLIDMDFGEDDGSVIKSERARIAPVFGLNASISLNRSKLAEEQNKKLEFEKMETLKALMESRKMVNYELADECNAED